MTNEQDWSVYIIACRQHTLYTGVTTDVQRRLLEHQAQGKKCAKYLRGKGPLTLVFEQCVGSKSEAYRLERLIKALSKQQKEAIIKSGHLDLN